MNANRRVIIGLADAVWAVFHRLILLYDALNRIASAQSSGPQWGETFTIDAWGNLTNRAAAPGMSGSCTTEPLSANATTSNQLGGIGMTYDAAGNVTNDGNGHQPTYDIENRIATVSGVTYYYDADGVRMEKSSGTMYWPGASGTLTETDLTGAINEEYIFFNGKRVARRDASTTNVYYYFSDHLGSTSLITNASGTLATCGTYSVPTGVDESDYYPYGGEMQLCNSSPQNYKFTGKERDAESGLDEFGARYYGSSLGRFMTPDWAEKPIDVPYAEFGNPQSLNLYSYVKNNPTTTRDPDGHCAEDFCIVEGTAAAGAAVYIGGAALLAGTAAVLSTPSGQRSLSTFTSAASQSISDKISGIKSFFSKSSDSKPAPATPATGDKQPQPLVGNNPKDGGSRTNTDLPGGHEAATGTFGEQTTGQAVRTDPNTGHQVSEDGSRLRLNPDGTARVDLPNRGSKPNGETVHFNNPDPKPPADPKPPTQ